MNWKQTAIAVAIASSLVGIGAYAQQSQPPAQGMMGHGMMDRFGPGGRGDTPGYGMGHGMMGHGGNWGMGPGMMGSCMMGPGMMGPGMMGPGMMGPGMMGPGMLGGFGMGAVARLDLDENQRKQVLKLEDDLRRKNWDLMGKMQDEMAKMRDALSTADKRDRSTVLAANKRMAELRQQMLENALDTADKAEALLNAKQREELRRMGAW